MALGTPTAGGGKDAIIRRVWWQPFRIPFRAPFVTSAGSVEAREGLVVAVESESGTVGLGEASPLPHYNGGSLVETENAVASLASRLRNLRIDEAWNIDTRLDGVSAGSLAAAQCGIEAAVGDLVARAHGQPLWRMFALEPGVPTGATAAVLPVNGTIDATDILAAVADARRLTALGHRVLKLKVGIEDHQDVERVHAIRQTVGAGIELRIDANGAWTVAQATRVLRRLEPLAIGLCEQPTPVGLGTGALAEVRAASPIAIAADESCRSLDDLGAIIEARAADAVVVKPMASGLRESLAMIARARRHSLPVTVTTMFDAGIGTAVAMHLAAVAGDPPPVAGLGTLGLLAESLVTGVPSIADGRLELSDRPGLGIELDAVALARCAIGPRRECQ